VKKKRAKDLSVSAWATARTLGLRRLLKLKRLVELHAQGDTDLYVALCLAIENVNSSRDDSSGSRSSSDGAP
jgi:hypothetical protein